jgi:hypothetical protein
LQYAGSNASFRLSLGVESMMPATLDPLVSSSPRLTLRALLGTAGAVALLAGASCGEPYRPPPLADWRAPAGDAGMTFVYDATTFVPTCNLGPEGGVCACADQPLLGDPPTLYFVLDRSGSMADLDKWGTVQRVLLKLVAKLGPRARFGAAVFPNPGAGSCAPGVEVFPPRRGDAWGSAASTQRALATTLAGIGAFGGTPTAATLQSLLPHVASLGANAFVILATDGGPNCDAMTTCGAADCIFNIDDAAGCPPAGPHNCCADVPDGGMLSCLDANPTIDAVRAIASSGVPVFVIGIPGSKPYATLLDELAQAGGTARSSSGLLDGGGPDYYAVDTASEAAFETAMAQIAAKITGTCTFDLGQTPPDPLLVNVFLDEHVLPQGGADGWTLAGSAVTILGASCQEILTGGVLDVRVVAGCPTITF